MQEIKKASFLQGEVSQILALSDAQSSANEVAISQAFDAVARTRGLAQIASDSGVSLDDLHRALAKPARPDISILMRVLESLTGEQPDPADAVLAAASLPAGLR